MADDQKKPVINAAACDGLPTCVIKRMCPAQAITQEHGPSGGPARIDPAKCTGCGLCVKLCPHHAASF